ncbi:MAG: NTPase [Sphingobacteriaceae bacterium]|nr:NTPase [Sphingobacteriaceae bacterium]
MWADNETSEDLLGFRVHAELLIDVINDENVLPVTIGVFGDWGSGKSSILKIVHEELSGENDELKDGTLVLYFNGWIFEGYDDAKAALLESIIEKFETHKTLGNKVKNKTAKLLKSVNWMRVLGLGFKKVVIPTAAAYLTGGVSLIPSLLNEFSNIDGKTLADKLQGEGADEFLKDLIKKNEPDESKLVREFRDDFKALIEESEIKKLVVIIDDLDRCTPERLIENLEAVKLFLNVEKTAFVIGADPRIVRHAIEHRYKTDRIEFADDPNSRNSRIVSDYLEKLIQVPYILPKLSDNEVETYMTLLFCKKELTESFGRVHSSFCAHREKNRYGVFGFGDIESIITEEEKSKLGESVSLLASLSSIITEGLNGNPRQIKRFLNTFTLRNRLVHVAKIPDFRIDVLAKLMVLEYSAPSLFKKIYDWQALQKGEPKEITDLEKLGFSNDLEEIKKQFSPDWATEKVIRWLNVAPKLTNIDLRDYYWISRDQLMGSISGSSLVPTHIRTLFKKLVEHGSGTILSNTISKEVVGKLSDADNEVLLSLLEKEVSKMPENGNLHKVFIELMAQCSSGTIESYTRAIKQMDHEKIPFSLRNDFILAAKKNTDVERIYAVFKPKSQISKALLNQSKN